VDPGFGSSFEVFWLTEMGFSTTQIADIRGDLNCDQVANTDDIMPFALALVDSAAYGISYPDCDVNLADLNNDGFADGADIQMMIDLLINP